MQKLPRNLKNDISSSETLRTEFKESYSDKQAIRYSMISFANAIGGRIYIGVKEISNEAGLHTGKIIDITRPGISEASGNARQWAESLLPKIDVTFNSYKEGSYRVDVIEVTESNQKPVCSSSGTYKIRTGDGNTGMDPSRMREIIVGYEAYKSALKFECERNIDLLKIIQKQLHTDAPMINLNELSHSSIDVILTNGSLSSHFNIMMLKTISDMCIRINKLLDFSITAGGVVYEQKVFYNKILNIIPLLQKDIKELLTIIT